MTLVYIATTSAPIGRFGGALSAIRPDDLAAAPLPALMSRNPGVDWDRVDDVILGCANQAGEDNRTVARMAALLAGLPVGVTGTTINRLCGSGMDAVLAGARMIASDQADLVVAGGVESMSRAPFVMAKADAAFSRHAEIHDTTIGWRFVNPAMHAAYGTDSMPQTAQNVADEHGISRDAQDAMALASQTRAAAAQASGRLTQEIAPVSIPQRKGLPLLVDRDEHPRATSMEALGKLAPLFAGGSVTAGNASGVNDGAAALILASARAVTAHDLTPLARVLGGATAGVPPRVMGIGPAPASQKLMARLGLTQSDFDVIELNEAFAAQGLAALRLLGITDDDLRVKASYRLQMDAIMEKNGGKDMRQTTRQAVRAALGKLADTPKKASRYAQTISLLWKYARKELDWPLDENPASGLAKHAPKRPYEPWPDWMVKALETAPERVRTAATLIIGTGQRPNAAITMRRDAFDGDCMRVTDEKGRKEMTVFCPPSLRSYIEALPKTGAHVLAKNLTEPQGYWALESAFRKWRETLGERAAPFTLHGLRKLAIVQLAEAGCSDAEIMAVTGQSAQMVAHYRMQANKRHLSKQAQNRREQNKTET